MIYKIFVRERETKKASFIEIESTTKKEAKEECQRNGYTVIEIHERDFYNYLLDHTNMNEKSIKEYKKDFENWKKEQKKEENLTIAEKDIICDILDAIILKNQLKINSYNNLITECQNRDKKTNSDIKTIEHLKKEKTDKNWYINILKDINKKIKKI